MEALAGKVALVTGASSGIGRETAKLFAQNGAALVLVARRRQALDALLNELSASGARAVALAGNVADEACAQEAVRLAVASFGGLDVAVNNAGALGEAVPTPELSLAQWRNTLDINLTGAFLGAKHQLPAMLRRGGGSMIFTSSFVGYRVGLPNMAAYAASKAGLIGLTQALAGEFGGRGIRVNALLPGGTDTPMGREAASSPEARAWVEGLHALKRLARPEEIAQSALYLASDASSFTTGTALLVDGGVSISRS
ncbi:SDR family oxidoreductase [Chromobacterium amazonense]|uniref:SDR family oxidoreductase n=1 Tax=Chromobacterium amazonense TaxID=1382803 RepID=UPI003F79130F